MGNSKKKNKKKSDEIKLLTVEFKVSMHCNACERSVAKAIAKLKGVEKFMTDMRKHKVVVIGKFDPEKVAKKLRKKTGKAVEIVADKVAAAKNGAGAEDLSSSDQPSMNPVMLNCCKESAQLMVLFSDENPNACCIM